MQVLFEGPRFAIAVHNSTEVLSEHAKRRQSSLEVDLEEVDNDNDDGGGGEAARESSFAMVRVVSSVARSELHKTCDSRPGL